MADCLTTGNAEERGASEVAKYMSKLDDKGRCCGRKPIVYRGSNPHLYCDRCDRSFDSKSGEQIENWAWKRVNGSQAMFVKGKP